MIEQMRFLSITGPKADIDRVVETYLSKYPIHLENALSELAQVRDLTPYIEVNPYREWLAKAQDYVSRLPAGKSSGKAPGKAPVKPLASPEEAAAILDDVEKGLRESEQKLARAKEELTEKEELRRQIAPYHVLPVDISKLLHFHYVKYRFGRIPRHYYKKFESYVYENRSIIFQQCLMEDDYVWGVYFVPRSEVDEVDAVLSSLHFERIFLPDSYEGTAGEAFAGLQRDCSRLEKEIKRLETAGDELLAERADDIRRAEKKLAGLCRNFDVRKLAACTQEHHNKNFYILCGWMSEADAAAFQKAIAGDEEVNCIIEEAETEIYSAPPTRLKNPKIFKPYEMYVKMYGLPNYRELDPTIFVALTYSFLFGAMFGDLGQGLCLLLGGFLLYKAKKLPLAGIISTAGFFSSIFGVLFGSFFGFENVIPALWLHPKEAMMQVPLVGNLNTVFVAAILFGMFLILSTMVLHIINAVKAHRRGDAWFDTNGAAGFVFYATLTVVIILFVTGRKLPAGILLAVLLLGPVVVLALKEPLTNLVEKNRPLTEEGWGMYAVQTFFELFETMLSFFSNTLSFVRVGAFAVSHAAMMEVVLMLAGAENGGHINWIAVILGNLFVSGMEGLIVGIQVLRLEYYEMFGRFYRGDGKEFRAFGKTES